MNENNRRNGLSSKDQNKMTPEARAEQKSRNNQGSNDIRINTKVDMIPVIVVSPNEKPEDQNQNNVETSEKLEEFRGGLTVINNKCEKRSSFSRMAHLRQRQQAEEDNADNNNMKNINYPKGFGESDQIEEKQLIFVEGTNSNKHNISIEELARARGAIRKLSLRSKTMKDQVNVNLNILGDFSPYISLRAEGSPLGLDGTWSKRHGTVGSNNVLSNSQLNAFQESPISLVNKNDQSCNFASDTTYQEDFISEQLLHPSLSKMPGNQVLEQYQSPKEGKTFVQEEDNEEEGEEEEDEETASNFINLYKPKGYDSLSTPQKRGQEGDEGEEQQQFSTTAAKSGGGNVILSQKSTLTDQQKNTSDAHQSKVDSRSKKDKLPNNKKKNQQAYQLASNTSEKSTARSSSKQDSNNIRNQTKLNYSQTPSKDQQLQQEQQQRIQQQSMYYMQSLKQTPRNQENKSDSHKNSSKEHVKFTDFSDSSKGKITANSGRQTVSSNQMNSMYTLGGKSVPCLSQFFEQSGNNRDAQHGKIPQYFSQKCSLTDITTAHCLESEKDNQSHNFNNNNDKTKTPQQSQEVSATLSKQSHKQQKSHQNSEQIIQKKPITVSLESTQKHQPSIHQHLTQKSSVYHDSIQRVFSLQDPSSKADEATFSKSTQGNNINKQFGQLSQINNNNSSPGSKYTLSVIATELSKSSRNTAQLLTKIQQKTTNNANITPQATASTATTLALQKPTFKGREVQGADAADFDKNKIKQVNQILMVNLSKTKPESSSTHKRKSQAQIPEIQILNRNQRTKSLNEEAKKASQSLSNLLDTAKMNIDSLFKTSPLLSSFEHPPSQVLKSDGDIIHSEQKSPKAMKIISLQDSITPSYSQIHAKNHLSQFSASSEQGMKTQSRRESLATCPLGISIDWFKELLPVKGTFNSNNKPQIIELTAKQNSISTSNKQNGQQQSRFTAPSTPAKQTKSTIPTGNNFNSQNISNSAGYSPPSPVFASQFQQIPSKISRQTPTLSSTSETIPKQPCISPKQSSQYKQIPAKAVFESISLSSSKTPNKTSCNGQHKFTAEDSLQQQQLSGTYYAKRKSGINFKQISQLS